MQIKVAAVDARRASFESSILVVPRKKERSWIGGILPPKVQLRQGKNERTERLVSDDVGRAMREFRCRPWYVASMRWSSAFIISLLVVGLLGACSKKVMNNGIVVYESYWNFAKASLAPLASRELACPREQLRYALLRRDGKRPTEMAVSGCGRMATYERVGSSSTWRNAAAYRAN